MTLSLTALEKAAREATPGTWYCNVQGSVVADSDCKRIPRTILDSEFIATFNPQTVLKLIAVARAAGEYVNSRLPDLDEAFRKLAAALKGIEE